MRCLVQTVGCSLGQGCTVWRACSGCTKGVGLPWVPRGSQCLSSQEAAILTRSPQQAAGGLCSRKRMLVMKRLPPMPPGPSPSLAFKARSLPASTAWRKNGHKLPVRGSASWPDPEMGQPSPESWSGRAAQWQQAAHSLHQAGGESLSLRPTCGTSHQQAFPDDGDSSLKDAFTPTTDTHCRDFLCPAVCSEVSSYSNSPSHHWSCNRNKTDASP